MYVAGEEEVNVVVQDDTNNTTTVYQVAPGNLDMNLFPIFAQEPQDLPYIIQDEVAVPKRSIHIRALIITLLLYAGIFFSLACNINFTGLYKSCTTAKAQIAPIIGVIVVYIAYILECFLTGSRYYTHVIKDIDYASNYIGRMLENPPYLYVHWQNYHYETRVRTVTRTDSNGNSYTTTETYQEKVITSTGNTPYHITTWRDFSGNIPMLPNVKAFKLSAKKTFRYADTASRNNKRRQKTQILIDNKADAHIEGNTLFTIPGYKPYMMVLRDKSKRPAFFTFSLVYIIYNNWIEFSLSIVY